MSTLMITEDGEVELADYEQLRIRIEKLEKAVNQLRGMVFKKAKKND